MNKPNPIDKYILVPTEGGIHVSFPVSKHVLQVGQPVPKNRGVLTRVRKWRPSPLQQSAAFLLMVSLFASSYGVTYGHLDNTLAYFRDAETSADNVLQAGALDFVVTPDGDVSAIIEAGARLVIPVMTPEPGTFPTMYRVVASTTAPVAPLCAALDATATTSPFTYGTADLLALVVTATTTSGPWPLEISLPNAAGLTAGDECVVDIVYRGWHKDVPENTGYTDEERFQLTLTYGVNANLFNIVLNEFLPNPDNSANGMDFGNDASNMPDGEWIELFNNGDVPLDIAGWYMSDASGGLGNTHAIISATNTLPATTTIPAHGWLVVYMNKPSLNNTGDEIYLYTPQGVQIDFVSYDNPSDACELELTPGSTNSTSTPSGTPGDDCISNQVAPNKSYARIPDGTGAWVDPIPTPGAPNIPDPPVEPEPEVAGAAVETEAASTSPETEEELVDPEEPSEPAEPAEPSEPGPGNWSPAGPPQEPTPPASPETPDSPAPLEEPEDSTEPPLESVPPLTGQAEEPADAPPTPEPQTEPEPEPSTEPPPPTDVPPPAEEPAPPPPVEPPPAPEPPPAE